MRVPATESRTEDQTELLRLFSDQDHRERLAAGSARLCREEFDLDRNVGRLCELLGCSC